MSSGLKWLWFIGYVYDSNTSVRIELYMWLHQIPLQTYHSLSYNDIKFNQDVNHCFFDLSSSITCVLYCSNAINRFCALKSLLRDIKWVHNSLPLGDWPVIPPTFSNSLKTSSITHYCWGVTCNLDSSCSFSTRICSKWDVNCSLLLSSSLN